MIYLRRNALNILLFILWLGMALSLTSANADGIQLVKIHCAIF